jgi:hypothetical protein
MRSRARKQANSGFCGKIPDEKKQGIIFGEQGIGFALSGNSRAH